MKILHFINSLDTGGAETLVVDLANEARRFGDKCDIAVAVKGNGAPLRKAERLGIKPIVLGKSLYDPMIIFRLRSLAPHYDVLHVHLFPAMYYSYFLSCTKVFTEHSTNNRRIFSNFWQRWEKLVYGSFDAIFAISDGVKQRLDDYFKTLDVNVPICVTPNGISMDFFEQSEYTSPQNHVCIVSSLKELKQVDLAIKAIAGLEGFTLSIAGDGPMREDLEQLVMTNNLENRISFYGIVDDVPKFLSNADLLLCTSKFEGFSLAAAEAQALGIPVVGPNVMGFNEVVLSGVTGELFDSWDLSSIRKSIKTALQPDNHRKYSKAAKKHSRKFGVDQSFLRQRALYQSVIPPQLNPNQ